MICAHNAARHARRVPAAHLRARLPRPRDHRRRRRLHRRDRGDRRAPPAGAAGLGSSTRGLAVGAQRGLSRRRRGDLIAYLDADAYPTPEWPYYLALGLDAPDVGGVGGPNLAARRRSARRPRRRALARRARSTCSPPTTGPSTSRAATWRSGSMVLDRGRRLRPGLHGRRRRRRRLLEGPRRATGRSASTPRRSSGTTAARAARLPAPAARLRAQRGAGRGPAPRPLHRRPGTARWRGRIYNSLRPVAGVGSGSTAASTATAAYQSVYQAGATCSTSCTRSGMPLAAMLLLTRAAGACSRPGWRCPRSSPLVGARRSRGRRHGAHDPPPRRCPGAGSASAPGSRSTTCSSRWSGSGRAARHRNVARRGLEPQRLLPERRPRRAGRDRRRPRGPAARGARREPRRRAPAPRHPRARQPSGWEDYDARAAALARSSTASCRPAAIRRVSSRCGSGRGPRRRPCSPIVLGVVAPRRAPREPALRPAAASRPRPASRAGAVLARRLPARMLSLRGCGGRDRARRPDRRSDEVIEELIGEEPRQGRAAPRLEAPAADPSLPAGPTGSWRSSRSSSRSCSRSLALAEPWPLAFVVDSIIGDKAAPGWVTGIFGDERRRR